MQGVVWGCGCGCSANAHKGVGELPVPVCANWRGDQRRPMESRRAGPERGSRSSSDVWRLLIIAQYGSLFFGESFSVEVLLYNFIVGSFRSW